MCHISCIFFHLSPVTCHRLAYILFVKTAFMLLRKLDCTTYNIQKKTWTWKLIFSINLWVVTVKWKWMSDSIVAQICHFSALPLCDCLVSNIHLSGGRRLAVWLAFLFSPATCKNLNLDFTQSMNLCGQSESRPLALKN